MPKIGRIPANTKLKTALNLFCSHSILNSNLASPKYEESFGWGLQTMCSSNIPRSLRLVGAALATARCRPGACIRIPHAGSEPPKGFRPVLVGILFRWL